MVRKTVYLVRHAQGPHNIGDQATNKNIRDPSLTEQGERQCEELCANFPHHDKVQLLLASPLTRTIQTAQIGFKPFVDKGHKILAMPNAQESSDDPCDTGSEMETLQKRFGDGLDFKRLSEVWHLKQGKHSPDVAHLQHRGRFIRSYLAERDEDHIVLVSHGDFLHHVTGNINQDGEQTGPSWTNAEWRSYNYAPGGEEGEYELVETEESRNRRKD